MTSFTKGMRIMVCSLISIVSVTIITAISVIIGSVFFQKFQIDSFSDMISSTMNNGLGYTLCNVIAGIFVYLFYKFFLGKQSITFESIGFSRNRKAKQIILGFVIGALFVVLNIIILIITKQVIFKYKTIDATSFFALAMGLIIFIAVAFIEETTYRGYIQHIFSQKSPIIGIVVSAVLFALSHLLNSNYSMLSLVYLFISGLLLGQLRLYSKNIWFPIGFHVAWNWVEQAVFGYNNAGELHWLSTIIVKDSVWNGGQSGSGIILIILEVLLMVGLIIFLKKPHTD